MSRVTGWQGSWPRVYCTTALVSTQSSPPLDQGHTCGLCQLMWHNLFDLKKVSVTQPFRQDESGTVPSSGNEGVNATQSHGWETQSSITERYAECEGTQSKATEPSLGAGKGFPLEVTPKLKLEG